LAAAGEWSVAGAFMRASLCQKRAAETSGALRQGNISLLGLLKINGGGCHEHDQRGARGRRR
jgi:hypothetical protein